MDLLGSDQEYVDQRAARDCLRRLEAGDGAAREELFLLLQTDLKRLAASYLENERPGHTLQPTALVHEAWLRLVGEDGSHETTRSHFLAMAARVMRHILIDHARSKLRKKRGGEWRRIPAEAAPEPAAREPGWEPEELLEVDEGIELLRGRSPRLARAIELQVYGGLSVDEIAAACGWSRTTTVRDLRAAKAFLKSTLAPTTEVERGDDG